MDAQLIEKLDRRRYNHVVWWTVGFTLFFAGLIAKPYVEGEMASAFNSYVVWLGGGIFFVTMILSYRNEKTIRSDPDLLAALDNEMVVFYKDRARKMAFRATFTAIIVLFLISEHIPELTAHFACLLLMCVSGLTMLIAQLVYLKK